MVSKCLLNSVFLRHLKSQELQKNLWEFFDVENVSNVSIYWIHKKLLNLFPKKVFKIYAANFLRVQKNSQTMETIRTNFYYFSGKVNEFPKMDIYFCPFLNSARTFQHFAVFFFKPKITIYIFTWCLFRGSFFSVRYHPSLLSKNHFISSL
jgi:hypothetical protein